MCATPASRSGTRATPVSRATAGTLRRKSASIARADGSGGCQSGQHHRDPPRLEPTHDGGQVRLRHRGIRIPLQQVVATERHHANGCVGLNREVGARQAIGRRVARYARAAAPPRARPFAREAGLQAGGKEATAAAEAVPRCGDGVSKHRHNRRWPSPGRVCRSPPALRRSQPRRVFDPVGMLSSWPSLSRRAEKTSKAGR